MSDGFSSAGIFDPYYLSKPEPVMTEINYPYPSEYSTLDPSSAAIPYAPTNIQHNWLYSFVPANIWNPEDVIDNYFIAAYLTGYCKQCDTGFSVPIPTTGQIEFKKLGVPKFGCSNDRS